MILEYYDFDKGFYDDGKRIYYPDMKDNRDKAESEDEPMTNRQKAAKAVHDLALAGYGDELNAILAFLAEGPIENLWQFRYLIDAEVAANPKTCLKAEG